MDTIGQQIHQVLVNYANGTSDIGLIEQTLNGIQRANLLSINEDLDDLNEITLLAICIYYLYAEVLVEQPSDRRIEQLQLAQSKLQEFREWCQSYQITPAKLDGMDRDQKIARYKAKNNIKLRPVVNDFNVAEDWLMFCYLSSVDSNHSIRQELQLISTERPQQVQDTRQHNATTSSLIDEQGQVLRPFVITSRKSTEVFKRSHKLPTMTIDEFMTREHQRGNHLQQSQPTHNQQDSDSEEERIKKINWDHYTENNPRGQGNSAVNRG